MSQKRTFVLQLKNNLSVTLEFTSIETTGDRLWQMFATTESLDIVQQLVDADTVIKPNAPTKKSMSNIVKKTVVAKKKK